MIEECSFLHDKILLYLERINSHFSNLDLVLSLIGWIAPITYLDNGTENPRG